MRWKDDINNNPPKPLPLHLVPIPSSSAPGKDPKTEGKSVEEDKLSPDDLSKEEMAEYASTITGIDDTKLLAEAMACVFGKAVPDEKVWPHP